VKRALFLLLITAGPLQAQGPGFEVGRLFTEPGATTYRLGYSAPLAGPLSAGLSGTFVDGDAPIGNLWGGGVDLALFKDGRSGPYLVGGVAGGLVTEGHETVWGSWSAGLGYEVFLFNALALGAEGRYRSFGPGDYHGLELGFRLGLHRRGRSGADPGDPPGQPAAMVAPVGSDAVRSELEHDGVASADAATIASVVQTAEDVMGSPYRWGGDGEEGFDCSGLIRYAFARQGIDLPRTSAEQAREGVAVERKFEAMRPGDILSFSNRSDHGVTHVGLYLGQQRFIHSANGGVQISVLDDNDPAGRWWFRRWVGVRRVVG
jgi:hypothetical protein